MKATILAPNGGFLDKNVLLQAQIPGVLLENFIDYLEEIPKRDRQISRKSYSNDNLPGDEIWAIWKAFPIGEI